MLLAERFISSLVGIHDSQHPVSTDEVLGIYPQACRFFLRLPHHISIPLMRKAL